MYGLKKNIDLSFLSGKEISQVCLGAYQISLNFLEDLSITIESDCALVPPDSTPITMSASKPKLAKELVVLIGAKIISADNNKGKLTLAFSNQYKLILVDGNPDYESYQISHDGKIIIV